MISLRVVAAQAALALAVFALSGCSQRDVYPLSLHETYKRLNAADIAPSKDGMFFTQQTTVTGNSADEVTWSAGGSGEVACTMRLAKVDDTHTKVSVSCKGDSPSSSASVEKIYVLLRSRVIEMVDATLTGRKFSPMLANGVTAVGWPEDGNAALTQRLEASAREEQRRAEALERERERQLLANGAEPAQSDYSEYSESMSSTQ